MRPAWGIRVAAAWLALAVGHVAVLAEEATKQRLTATGSAEPAAVLLETKEAVDSAPAAAALVMRKSGELLKALFAREAQITVIDSASTAPGRSSTVALPEVQFQFPYATAGASGAYRVPHRPDPAAPIFEVRVPVLLKGAVFTVQEGNVLVGDREATSVVFLVDSTGNIYW